MTITRDDVKAGKVLPHLIENNIWVPPSLRIGESTLQEHLAREKLTPEEIERLYGVEQEPVTPESNEPSTED